MNGEEFDLWREHSFRQYSREKEKSGLSKEDAEAEATRSFSTLLPAGKDSKGHYLYSIVEEASGVQLGILWWGPQKSGTSTIAWIYDIEIKEEHRGKGIGKQAMQLAFADVKTKGFETLGLHVFGHNETAQKLYSSLGFEVKNIVMQKKI